MGSMITLAIGRMEIDWGKNYFFRDHSALFQAQDVKLIPYYYVDTTGEPIIEMKEGFSRKLSSVEMRLDLLGYDLVSIRKLYEDLIIDCEADGCTLLFPFEEFYNVVSNIDIEAIDAVDTTVDFDEFFIDEYAKRYTFDDPQSKYKLQIENYKQNKQIWYPNIDLETFFGNLDPYITLRILAENPNNDDVELYWRFADVVENGWTTREDIVKQLPSDQKILIVTEGSTDTFVIRRAINTLYPDIADFFDFIDMEKHYPFTGVGNLSNFCLGLIRINILNKILVIFDNDTAAAEKYQQLETIDKPNSLLITKLPDHKDFENFTTFGPQGETSENINGKAVAIECFLDHNSIPQDPAVRWTSFNKQLQQYQGELIDKKRYIRAFKCCDLSGDSFNCDRLKYLIDYILEQWIHSQEVQ